MPDLLTSVLLAATATNVAFIRISVKLLLCKGGHDYSNKQPTSKRHLTAYIAAFLLMCCSLSILLAAPRKFATGYVAPITAIVIFSSLAVAALGLVCLDIFHVKESLRNVRSSLSARAAAGVVVITIVVAGGLFATMPYLIITTLERIFLLASPLAAVPLIWAVRMALDDSRMLGFADHATAPYLQGRAPGIPRIIWMIFDEFDYRLAFAERPHDLRMPKLDHFLQSAVVSSNAYPPCRCTEISMAAFFTGRLVAETIARTSKVLDVLFSLDEPRQPLHSLWTIFHDLRKRSLNCGVLTWYHPFGRLFGDSVVRYAWLEAPTQENAVDGGVIRMMLGYLRSLFETPKYSLFGSSMVVEKCIQHYNRSRREALEFVRDSMLDLGILHFPIPHAPYIYDRHQARLLPRLSSSDGYIDNLALADRLFGECQEAMCVSGQWTQSVVIVTSDHWWRYAAGFDGKKDMRVPFAVHFPGQTTRTDYHRRFNTVATRQLVLAILDGSVTSPEELVTWLDTNAVDAMPTKT